MNEPFLDKIQGDVCLKSYSTMKVGGKAKFFTKVSTKEELSQALQFASQNSVPFFVLGKGSNCIFDDAGFNGLIILNKIDFVELEGTHLFAGAGVSFSWLGTMSARKSLSGLEFASGIPGSLGGAVYMNAGANGFETKDNLESVDFMNERGEVFHFKKDELEFSYRSSPFQKMKGSIVGASFKLALSGNARLKQIELIEYRKKTQPLKDPSAGCVFQNAKNESAGSLIEKAGLKGVKVGGAEVSPVHANFIVNLGDAKASDIKELSELIQERVKASFGHELKREVCFISSEGLIH